MDLDLNPTPKTAPRRVERLARSLLFFLLLAAAAIPLAGKALAARGSTGVVTLHARMAENGGWGTDVIQARVGQPLHLRITSDDVQHSFAVGQMNMQPVQIEPGQWQEVTLTFDKPGQYTLYCDRWCGPEHWRMRGTIQVSGDANAAKLTPEQVQPLYLALKIDVDAPHPASVTPAAQPDAARGARLAAELPGYALERQTYLASSPAALWKRLRAEPGLAPRSDAELWDAVAWLWQRQTTPQQLAEGKALYAQNCAACHGESGKGDGVMMRGLPTPDPEMKAMTSGSMRTRPPDWSDPHNTLGASPALLEGKMTRGGMGTGMPMWGSIFTHEQMDALVSYIYSLMRINP